MTMSGADADALDNVGVMLEQASDRLRHKADRLTSELHSAPWHGMSAERFRQQFDTEHYRSILRAAQFLDDAYETLRRNAEQQRAASGEGQASLVHQLELLIGRLPHQMDRVLVEYQKWLLPLGFLRTRGHDVPGWVSGWPGWPMPWLRPHVPSPIPPWVLPFILGPAIGIGFLRPPTTPTPTAPPTSDGNRPSNPGVSAPTAPAPAPASPSTTELKSWGRHIDSMTAKRIVDEQIATGKMGKSSDYDFNNHDGVGDDWYQCTVWAKARWREMGYSGPDWLGNGGQVAGNINQMLGRPDQHQPTVGAIMSKPGHVAVVEEIRTLANGQQQVRVSEMNVKDGNSDYASSSEFSDTNWYTVDGSQTFASFPG